MLLQLNTLISNLNFSFHLQASALAELGPAQPQLVLFSFFLCGLLSEYICFILYTEDHSTSILTYLAEKNGPNMVLSVGTKPDFDLCRVSFDDVEYFLYYVCLRHLNKNDKVQMHL